MLSYNGFRAALVVVVLLLIVGAASAQEPEMTEPLALGDQIHVLEIELAPTGPPSIEMTTDDRIVFSAEAAGTTSGAIAGTMTSRISEVNRLPPPANQTFSETFVIETELGRLEGFYAGSIFVEEGTDAAPINAHGYILNVSGAYADLFMAEVFVSGQVNFVDGRSTGAVSTMTIFPR